MVSSSPILDLFAEELKISREAAGLSQQQLAEAIRYSSALVGKVEQRDRRPNPDFASRCDTLFETNGLFGRIQRRLGHRDAFVVWLREWVAVEQEAVALRGYEPLYVPGLLQTEGYARAVLTGSRLLAKSAVEQQVSARVGRQEILARDEPPRLAVILDHAVLTRPVGGPAVMREQLEHLVRLGEALPLLKIHVVPAAIGAYAGLDGAFATAILGSGDELVYVEGPFHGQIYDRPEDVRAAIQVWEAILGEALSHQQSLELIEEVARTWS